MTARTVDSLQDLSPTEYRIINLLAIAVEALVHELSLLTN